MPMRTMDEFREADSQYRAARNEADLLAMAMQRSAKEFLTYADMGSQHGAYIFSPANCPSHDVLTTALTKLHSARYLAQEAWDYLSEHDQTQVSRPR
jgi:hypothetical protein